MNVKFYALPQEKQTAILNAGFHVFSQNSYKKSPVSEIAEAAGISKALLFHYFHNKKELYLFLWDTCARITVEAWKKTSGRFWISGRRFAASASKVCSETEYGRSLMETFIDSYSKDEYCRLAGHGMKMLAEAMEADLPYRIDCPAVLICGEKDQAGSAKSYNRRWAKKEGLPVYWIRDAGHNANTDRPEEVNRIIREFVYSL